MDLQSCAICFDAKTAMLCNSCQESSCKHCSYVINENEYEYLSLYEHSIEGDVFCPGCYFENVEPQLDKYAEILALAKDVDAYVGNRDRKARAIRRIEKQVRVEGCLSQEDALLRLGFLVAQKGFSTMVDVNLVSSKEGEGRRYKRLVWSGSAVPVDPEIKKY